MNNQTSSLTNETRQFIPLPVPSTWRSQLNVGNIVVPGEMRLENIYPGPGGTENITGTINGVSFVGVFWQGAPLGLLPVIVLYVGNNTFRGVLSRAIGRPISPDLPAVVVYSISGYLYQYGTTERIPWYAITQG